MGGGLIQLVSYGIQDMMLIGDPQITLFKTIYRRHTNFAIEPVPQTFNKANVAMGETVHCKLSRTGDMVYRVSLVVTLPPIAQFMKNGVLDPVTKFSWARRIGYAMISKISIELGGQVVDSQTGEWMNIWSELTLSDDKNHATLIGDIPDLTDWSNGKDAYTIHVPLSLWFSRHNILALPIVALQYSQPRIIVEFADASSCYTVGPVHTLDLLDDTVQYKPYEYIEQNINGNIARGVFVDFNPLTRVMRYNRISDQPFTALTSTPADIRTRQRYAIIGIDSGYSAVPQDGTKEKSIRGYAATNPVFTNCRLDVEYVYLDSEERARISETAREYLIEQVQLAASKNVQSSIASLKLALNHPIKTIIVVVRLNSSSNANDWFNYTTSPYRGSNKELLGNNPIVNAELLFNGQTRTGVKPGLYYDKLQPYHYFKSCPSTGINLYSFAIFPAEAFPSGSANTTVIDDIELKLSLDPSIGIGNNANISVYGIGWNILRTMNGLGGMLFT
jgi:hypothetical protein